jgi:hypothetical protein
VSKRRGTEKRQRTVQVAVRLTPQEHAELEAEAAATGSSIPAILRARYFGEPSPVGESS